MTKQEALIVTKQLQNFLSTSLPPTGYFSQEQADSLATSLNLVIETIENDDDDVSNAVKMFGMWRGLAEFFGTSDDHPIMGPYNGMSADIILYLKNRS